MPALLPCKIITKGERDGGVAIATAGLLLCSILIHVCFSHKSTEGKTRGSPKILISLSNQCNLNLTSYYDDFFYHMISYSVAVWLSSLGAAYTFSVSSLFPRCLSEVWERDGETLSVTSQLMYCRVQDWPSRERNGTGLVSSSESRGRSVWSRKCSRTVRSGASPWDATRIELVPRLLRMLVCVLGTKNIFVSNQRPARIYRTAFVIFLHKGVDLQTRLLLITPRIRPLAGAGKLSSRRVSSENKPPKFTLQVSFDPLVSLRRKD